MKTTLLLILLAIPAWALERVRDDDGQHVVNDHGTRLASYPLPEFNHHISVHLTSERTWLVQAFVNHGATSPAEVPPWSWVFDFDSLCGAPHDPESRVPECWPIGEIFVKGVEVRWNEVEVPARNKNDDFKWTAATTHTITFTQGHPYPEPESPAEPKAPTVDVMPAVRITFESQPGVSSAVPAYNRQRAPREPRRRLRAPASESRFA